MCRSGLFYALLPVIPIALVLVFSPLLVESVKMHVVTAMIIGAVLGLVCELLVKRDVKSACKGFQVFFSGMGKMFTSVVSLLVCADVFAQGFQATGAMSFIINSVQGAGLGVAAMTVVMTLLVGATATITGSGVAAFFAFSKLAPEITASFGASAVSMILPMQLMAGMGRAISPGGGRDHRRQQGRGMLAVPDRAAHADSWPRRNDRHADFELRRVLTRKRPEEAGLGAETATFLQQTAW
jgi:DcuC family C4-dicarboxylate transporter